MLRSSLVIKVSGDPQSISSTKISQFSPEQFEKTTELGTLTILVSIVAKQETVNAPILVERLIQSFSRSYFEATADVLSNLKSSLTRVRDEYSFQLSKLEIITTVYANNVLYSAVIGFGQVAILRGESFAKILTGLGEIVVASGFPQEGDFLLMGTKEIFDENPIPIVKDNKDDLNLAANELTKFISSKRDKSLMGLAVLGFGGNFEELVINYPKSESSVEVSKRNLFEGLGKIKNVFAKVSGRQIYLRGNDDEERGGNKKTTITVGIILLILLIVSVVFGVKQRSDKQTRSKYEDRLNQAIHDFGEASSLVNLDQARSQELFSSSSNLVNQLVAEGVKDPDLIDLENKINSSRGNILKEYKKTLSNFVDLSLLSDGFKGSKMASSGGDIFVLDQNSKKVVQISIANKMSKVVAGPSDFNSATQIAAFEDNFFVLTDSGIKELGTQKLDVATKDWSGEVLIYSYAGNLYILDKSASKIWRYPVIQGGFASKQNWFGSGVTPDLTNIISWVLDGNVWLLSSNGKISKFSLGTSQYFSVVGLGMVLNNPSAIYTNQDNQNLYILDSNNSRVVVIDKKGVYKAEYLAEGLKDATNLVVSEKDKKAVFLLNGSLRYFDLENI